MERLCYVLYSTDANGVKYASRCVPYEGVKLYCITATYAKSVPPCSYYYLGHDKKEATQRFQSVMTWMQVLSVEEMSGKDAELVLTDMYYMPLE